MRIAVDRSKCCGAGQCVMLAPAVFDQDDEGVSFVLEGAEATADPAAVQEAVEACPTGAIAVLVEDHA